ncbi:MAG TPA: type II toxin-antitoxin system RelE/ParE family toxin [Burkholderiaceae bacterium]|nr:type II toxin-antitoxin system RelE/ParE family toxin [Burkholderiaceae bacterium]HMX10147.1 type II toxin-antitoxin system RelE/ParE family toxin [Burkholderiaceae bacterium]HMY98955.1 type II toxin-antitoxin system RelE/ParE family toxin [Burkholderiaceae bacterium]HNB45542.1 type II toxin-antitoxin system RelE/ParE family toxin [Burkholderiaceae bacterium]HNG79272.1 type II toxin-antitoxin system RelE/ParE family toxin [Burkholderiaceae bacterium]
MTWTVRLSQEAQADLERLIDFILERELGREGGGDPDLADRALAAIEDGLRLLERFPFTCRKADDPQRRIPAPRQPFLRELVIPFGASGYVALFEIVGPDQVVVAALRHQREDDYH